MLAKFSVKKPFTILVIVILIIVFGCVSFSKMTPDLFPSIDLPYVMVMTTYTGASPEEVESEVTSPLEQQMATLENVKTVDSYSSNNTSTVMIEFEDTADMNSITVDVREKIDMITDRWDDKVGRPVIIKINPNMMPITVAAVSKSGMDTAELSDYVDDNVIRPLEGAVGVASVNAMGMVDDTVQVVLDQDKIDKVNNEIQDALGEKFYDVRSQLNKGINTINDQQNQLKSRKEQISQKQREMVEISTALTVIKQLVVQRTILEQAARLDNSYKKQLSQVNAQINKQKKVLKKYASTLKTVKIDPDTVDKDYNSINGADMAFGIYEKTASAALSNGMSELTSGSAVLQINLGNLKNSLSQVDQSEKSTKDSADLNGKLTMDTISNILTAQNFQMPAGYITEKGTKILVSVGDKIKNKKELKKLVIFDTGVDGVDEVKLSDVAQVFYADDSDENYARINGEDGILLTFSKQSNYSTADVSSNIAEKFSQLEKSNKGLKFDVLSDQGDYIGIVIDSVLESLLLGAILAILILLLFLRDIRPTLITACSIPISVTFAIVLMYFSGVTINVISLAGLAIGVGMLVDNSIVVIENTYRLRSMGYSNIRAAISGAAQVTGAITASTLTTICVFIPIVFVEGITRQIFTDMALTIAYSLIASLFIALTLVPAMSRGMLGKIRKNTMLDQDSDFIKRYKTVVSWGLSHRAIVLISAVVVLGASCYFAINRGFEYMPAMSSPQISVQVTLPDDSKIQQTSTTCDKIAEDISNIKGVTTVGAMFTDDANSIMGGNVGSKKYNKVSMYVLLDDDTAKDSTEVADKIEKLTDTYNCEITATGEMDMSSYSSAMGGTGISVNVFCDDLDDLRTSASKVEATLKGIKGTEKVSDIGENTDKELRVTVNKNKAMKKGLTVAQIYAALSKELASDKVSTTMTYNGNNKDVIVSSDKGVDMDKDDIKNLKIYLDGSSFQSDGALTSQTAGMSGISGMTGDSGNTGMTAPGDNEEKEKSVKLSQIANISDDYTLETINRENQKRILNVSAEVKDGYNITHLTSKAKAEVNKLNLPNDVDIEFAGENEDIMDSLFQLLMMLLLGMLMVYLVMVAQFQSVISPFIVMFTVPLAFTGGMLALLITGMNVSVVSMMGFIMLMGVVVNNAIVLIDCINRFRLDGMEKREAIINAGAVRLRPVIMTALTTVLGLIPLAIGIGSGGEMMQPVAVVCIGGLIYATLMTLVVIPIMYDLLNRRAMRHLTAEETEVISE